MVKRAVDPRSITDAERPYLDAYAKNPTAVQLHVIERLRERGERDQVGLSLVGWLAVKHAGLVDQSSSKTRAGYRRLLAEIGAPPTANGRAAPSKVDGRGASGSRRAAITTEMIVLGTDPLSFDPQLYITYRSATRRKLFGRRREIAEIARIERAATPGQRAFDARRIPARSETHSQAA